MKLVKRTLDIIEKFFCIVISILLAVMVASVFYQVILRYIFSGANIWAEELARYAFAWICLLGSVVGIRRYKHIRIDFFINLCPPKLRAALDILSYGLMLVFLGFLLRYGLLISSRTGHQLSGGLRVPMSFMYSCIPIGAFFMILFILEALYNQYLSPGRNKEREVEK